MILTPSDIRLIRTWFQAAASGRELYFPIPQDADTEDLQERMLQIVEHNPQMFQHA